MTKTTLRKAGGSAITTVPALISDSFETEHRRRTNMGN